MSDINAIVQRCCEGDLEAFAALFRCYQPRLYDLACTILRDEEMAADAVQDVYLAVFQKINSYQGDAAFETWLIAITVNQCRSRLRRRRVRQILSLESLRGTLLGRGKSTEAQVEERQQKDTLWQTVDRLEDRLRLPLILRYRHGLPAGEVAHVLDIPINRLYQQLYEGRQRLRLLLIQEHLLVNSPGSPEVESC
jgi:RNA polymerase sigma-70 factor (ECF subfamily)